MFDCGLLRLLGFWDVVDLLFGLFVVDWFVCLGLTL